uniref:Uncharacterized protein n=1 Tax=Monopterus albus TaxID=43700 RepID=A0A3Q3JIU3_MONAL
CSYNSYFIPVSVSLSEFPTPSQELVEKYNSLKSTFLKRLLKAQSHVAPLVQGAGDSEQGKALREYTEGVQSKPEVQAVAKVVSGVAQEADLLVDKARTAVLGLYEHFLRPHVGERLGEAIDHIKIHLDQILPAE